MKVTRRDFNSLLLGSAAASVPAWVGGCASVNPARADSLPRRSPSEQGVDSRAVLAFIDEAAAQGVELHSLMLFRRGAVVAEGWWWPYRSDRLHMQHSLTKSVTACGVGLAIAEGRFGLDDKVVSFFEDEVPANAAPGLPQLTVRDLLTMQTGHGEGVSGSVWRQITTSWVAEFFKLPLVHEPGTTFVYNSASSFMLSALITRTTGQSLRDYLEPRLFQPLDIRNVQWDMGPGGINPGGNGLSWTTLDTLKLGLLHLQEGQWEGRQILPASWVSEATRPRARNGRYGYQWWMGPSHSAYYAAGLFGQFCFVFPEHDAVLACTAGATDEKLRDLVWRYFPAAFESEPGKDAVLAERCRNLRLLEPLTGTSSPRAQAVSGRKFAMQTNEDQVLSVRFDFNAERVVFSLQDARGTHNIAVGLHDWIESDTTMTGGKLHHQYEPDSLRVVAGGRWLDERTFEMTWQFVETAFRDKVVCRFDGDSLTLDRSVNVNSAATSRPTLRGVASSAGT
jgi:CubicO group peptidase (beta-lactamase class C family)